jgi:alpha-galactosidase
MSISFDEKLRIFSINTSGMSYIFHADPLGRVNHLHWGPPVNDISSLDVLVKDRNRMNEKMTDHHAGCTQAEYPDQEPHEFEPPALLAIFPDGVRDSRLRYIGYRLDASHLTVTLKDTVYNLYVDLHYRTFEGLDLISRWAVIRNDEDSPVTLDIMESAAFYLPPNIQYRLTHFAGRWGAEYQKQQSMLNQSRVVLESHRGVCAAHQIVPFFALDPWGRSTETSGELYFGALQWSGNFEIIVQQSPEGTVSVLAGIGSHDTEWRLNKGESFKTPAVITGFTSGGFEDMSKILYDLQYDYLFPRSKAYKERPVIYNSWYPYEFSINEANILGLIEKAADIGVELFVIDDGWMEGRNNDRKGLGDWYIDKERFPRGFGPIIEACKKRNMLFGLWVEPEMVNPDSELYRKHPDWVIHDPTRERTESRNQLVLNFARDDVRDFAIKMLDHLIDIYKLDYLKWDMNRYFGETGWPDAESEKKRSISIRYIQNLYSVWQHLNEKYPDVLYENCAGGGGRADFGMVPFADRCNRSDNADPVDLMRIHDGYTTLFPPKSAGGAGNISPSPNNINGRVTPLEYRIDWGMTGSMSIGIDLLKTSREELNVIKEAVREFKIQRPIIHDCYVYRISCSGPWVIFQYLKRDRKSFVLFCFGHGLYCRQRLPLLRMRGLIPEAVYSTTEGLAMSGEALMNLGLPVQLRGDYASSVLTFKTN